VNVGKAASIATAGEIDGGDVAQLHIREEGVNLQVECSEFRDRNTHWKVVAAHCRTPRRFRSNDVSRRKIQSGYPM
jgi:hypothetical protein